MGMTYNGYKVSLGVMKYSKIDCDDGSHKSVNILNTSE